ELIDDGGDSLNVIAAIELVVTGDVVGHDEEGLPLRRKSGALGIADDLSLLAAREDARVGIDGLRPALAVAHRVDREEAVEKEEERDGEESEEPSTLGLIHEVGSGARIVPTLLWRRTPTSAGFSCTARRTRASAATGGHATNTVTSPCRCNADAGNSSLTSPLRSLSIASRFDSPLARS